MNAPRRLPSIPAYDLPQEGDLPRSRANWTLEADRAALLVHDMQAYFVDAFTPDASPISSVIDSIARISGAARARGIHHPILFVLAIGLFGLGVVFSIAAFVVPKVLGHDGPTWIYLCAMGFTPVGFLLTLAYALLGARVPRT